MSCFGGVPATTGAHYRSASGRPLGGGRRPWRWWRAKCAGIAAAVGSRIRRSIRGVDGRRHRRRATSSSVRVQSGRWCHHRRSFAPVYVDELYSHHHQPTKAALLALRAEEPRRASDDAKLTAAPPVAHAAAARAAGGKPTARVGAGDGDGARASSGKHQARAAAAAAAGAVGGAMRNVLLRSPGRGGGVLGVVKGMGEVDLRAELFIRKFKEDMRLQSQRSAEEFQAMLARGL